MVDRLPNGLAGAVFVGQIVMLLYSFFNPVVCKSRWIWMMPRFGLGNLLVFVFDFLVKYAIVVSIWRNFVTK